MIRSLSTAASGMEAQQTRLDVTSNNIANVTTPGFKKSRAAFEDLYYQTLRSAGSGATQGSPIGLQVGMGVRTVGTQRIHSLGDLSQTNNPLDVTINGEGFFVVQTPNSETEQAYTRAGNFQRNENGMLATSDGKVLAGDIKIPPDATGITIDKTGAVTATMPGQPAPTEVGKIRIATFGNPAGLRAEGQNLYRETVASGNPTLVDPGQLGTGSLQQGQLEMSNVKIAEEMIDLISGQRAYEVNSRVIKAADEMMQQTANLR